MCSIITSYNKNKLINLIQLNQFRGSFSYSYTDTTEGTTVKGFGTFPDIIEDNENFKIVHIQAPTGGMIEDRKRIHPTIIHNTKLWHNGLLTPRAIKYIQKTLQTDEEFDTLLLHKMIQKFGFEILSEIEGLFSCLYIRDNEIFIFRTKHGKLYYNEQGDISSEKFDKSYIIDYDTVFRLDFMDTLLLNPVAKFKTKRYNFVIPNEPNEPNKGK